MTSPPLEPGRAPRAVTYARANQGVDRYRHPVHRPVGRTPAGPMPRRGNRMLNRKRFWFFAGVLAFAFVLGAATLSAVFAGPNHMARGPLAPPGGGESSAMPRSVPPPEPTADDEAERRTGEQTPGRLVGEEKRPTPAGAGAAPGGNGTAGGTGSGGAGPTGREGQAGAPDGPGSRGEPTPEPEPEQPTGSGEPVRYHNCNQARRAGAAPLHRGEPGYSAKLDRDGDGVACD